HHDYARDPVSHLHRRHALRQRRGRFLALDADPPPSRAPSGDQGAWAGSTCVNPAWSGPAHAERLVSSAPNPPAGAPGTAAGHPSLFDPEATRTEIDKESTRCQRRLSPRPPRRLFLPGPGRRLGGSSSASRAIRSGCSTNAAADTATTSRCTLLASAGW